VNAACHSLLILLVALAGHAQETDQGFPLVPIRQDAHPDVLTITADLQHQTVAAGDPRPGVVAWQRLPAYTGTEVGHTVYLPPTWVSGRTYPVVVEYLGNTAKVRDLRSIGYPLCVDQEMIWVVLPFIAADRTTDTPMWWGDVAATVAYAKEAVPAICAAWGGDPTRVALVGSSRGGIACNYIGLHDDDIARLWCAMIIVSHYDDMHVPWGMTPEEQHAAPERVKRLGRTPQLIVGEHTTSPQPWEDTGLRQQIAAQNLDTFATAKAALKLVPIVQYEKTRVFLRQHCPHGNVTFMDLPWVNHGSASWLRETPERQAVRAWLAKTLGTGGPSAAPIPRSTPGAKQP
jgi:hypothetical protein